jgi:hypothetical protein
MLNHASIRTRLQPGDYSTSLILVRHHFVFLPVFTFGICKSLLDMGRKFIGDEALLFQHYKPKPVRLPQQYAEKAKSPSIS